MRLESVTLGWEAAVTETLGQESFADFYRRYRPAMVRLAFLLTGGNVAAEDVVQDAFMRVYARWETVELPEAYLRTAVVNATLSYRRRLVLQRRVERELLDEPVEPEVDEMRDAVRRLPHRQRVAVVLRYYADLPEAEIAAAMGCRVPAVKSLLYRALKDLRNVVER